MKPDGVPEISVCLRCGAGTWPPNEICSRCFGPTGRQSLAKTGKIIEFSRKNGVYFCLAEFGPAVRIMGSLLTPAPKIGQQVRLLQGGAPGRYRFELVRGPIDD